jgi:hypothetical protein
VGEVGEDGHDVGLKIVDWFVGGFTERLNMSREREVGEWRGGGQG